MLMELVLGDVDLRKILVRGGGRRGDLRRLSSFPFL
jgi:hypothetical protein